MTKKKQKFSREEIERKINLRAWQDPDFKKRLIRNPHETLKEFGMTNIPHSVQIRAVEEEGDIWYLVLHRAPPNAKDLSEEDLLGISAADSTSATTGSK